MNAVLDNVYVLAAALALLLMGWFWVVFRENHKYMPRRRVVRRNLLYLLATLIAVGIVEALMLFGLHGVVYYGFAVIFLLVVVIGTMGLSKSRI